jgi:hypothetical protein
MTAREAPTHLRSGPQVRATLQEASPRWAPERQAPAAGAAVAGVQRAEAAVELPALGARGLAPAGMQGELPTSEQAAPGWHPSSGLRAAAPEVALQESRAGAAPRSVLRIVSDQRVRRERGVPRALPARAASHPRSPREARPTPAPDLRVMLAPVQAPPATPTSPGRNGQAMTPADPSLATIREGPPLSERQGLPHAHRPEAPR